MYSPPGPTLKFLLLKALSQPDENFQHNCYAAYKSTRGFLRWIKKGFNPLSISLPMKPNGLIENTRIIDFNFHSLYRLSDALHFTQDKLEFHQPDD